MNPNNPYLDVLRSPNGTPQFPGGDFLGMNLQQIRDLIKTQKRAKGFRFTLPIGASTFNLDISGTAKVFLGFIFGNGLVGTAISDTFSLVINNEIIIQSGNTGCFSTNRLAMSNEYFFFPRPLSGTDQVELRFQSTIAGVEIFDLWYL